jgi:two-component system response regulator AtoC
MRRLRVLVFEDNELIRSVLWRILEKRGYEVFTFPDPDSCPLYLAPTCPCPGDEACADIIITDIRMPKTSGLEFIENQLKKGCKVKNIGLMSSTWVDYEVECAQRLGCLAFPKPFNLNELNEWFDDCEKNVDTNRVLSDWFIDQISQ